MAMQMTGTFGALNSGIASGGALGRRKAIKTPQPKLTEAPVGRPAGLPGEPIGPLGKAPVNAFAGLQPTLSKALASGANAQSPVGDRLNKLPRRRRAV